MIEIGDAFAWGTEPTLPQFYLLWVVMTINAWCWTICALVLDLRFLNFSNQWLKYGRQAVLPFFVIHQPVTMAVALFVVEWSAGIPMKMLAVVLGSFVIMVGLYEVVIQRIDVLCALFGIKSAQRVQDMAGRKLLSQSYTSGAFDK